MNKAITFIMAMLGIGTSACSQSYQDLNVEEFSALVETPNTQLVDVRTPEEYAEGHLEGAINIDQKSESFMSQAKAKLDTTKAVAVYCRSGRRSADAATKLAGEGFQVMNLKGGILAWKEKQMPVTTSTTEVDIFKTKSGKTVRIYALMHASIRLVFDGKEVEIDPVRKLGDRTTDYTLLPQADFIFVTHEHGDHFDRDAIKQLTRTGTQFITNRRCADMAGYGLVMNNGDHEDLNFGIHVEAVPAYNITEGHTQFHPKGRDNGYILTLDGLRIYIAGDTEDISEMADIHDIDIAFLPCNQPYTMTTEQLVKAAKTIKPKVLFPYHYGQTDVSSIPEQLKGDGIDVRIRHYE
jgi:L-ascorbate metabolism protein UlaG (beta-lactamase superfamily)/rhodanese-related sulfurtransferase